MIFLRKAALLLLFTLMLLSALTACSAKPKAAELAQTVRDSYTSADGISMNAELTANYSSRAYSFSVKYEEDDGGGTVTVLEPESIAGISARIGEDGVTLIFDGAEVFTGEVTEDGLSPVDALPVIVKAWREGAVTGTEYVKSDGAERLSVSYRITDSAALITVFDTDTYLPVSAELTRDGYTVLTLEFLNVTVK